ncbi:hypothetical protein CDAR_252521 [Caerostris darwini]|uniref:Uncharacterized protein n=1 Tax=Caerostris darwini TaxID=1538125 RepID=A0AAV4WLE7_9ARAC|nr:hypothetical protein CDAR_252521 [Caerostris darwini]
MQTAFARFASAYMQCLSLNNEVLVLPRPRLDKNIMKYHDVSVFSIYSQVIAFYWAAILRKPLNPTQR